jgi:hypothetical protein
MTETLTTLKQWKRRALKAEAELETLQNIRKVETNMEMQMHRQLAHARVALNEIAEALAFAKGSGE